MRITPSRFATFADSDAASDLIARARSAAPSTAAAALAQRSLLEQRQPQLAQALTLLWGHPEMNALFDQIWTGEKYGGLDPSVMAELMLLSQLHLIICPTRPMAQARQVLGGLRTSDPWRVARMRS